MIKNLPSKFTSSLENVVVARNQDYFVKFEI